MSKNAYETMLAGNPDADAFYADADPDATYMQFEYMVY